jgi:predicted nucleic acid-binding protein
MRVVSNTSPLSNFAIVDRLALLRVRYGRIVIPAAVHDELGALEHAGGRDRLEGALHEGWIAVEKIPSPEAVAPFLKSLDAGEAEALALALQTTADVLLMDERKGREMARQHGQRVSGVIGQLVWAKEHGHIESVSIEMARLLTEARFFIHPALLAHVRREVGET